MIPKRDPDNTFRVLFFFSPNPHTSVDTRIFVCYHKRGIF